MKAGPRATPIVRPPDSEKLTINLGFVDLGQIDLLVAEGFYGNRSDFIRTAIRNQLTVHSDSVKQATARKMLVLGIHHFTAVDLRALQLKGEKLQIRVLGLATFADDVTPELALDTIDTLVVLGALHAQPALKAALAERLLQNP